MLGYRGITKLQSSGALIMAENNPVSKFGEGIERRRFERYSVRFLIYDNKKQRLGIMQDISILGMSFISNRDLDKAEQVEVNINLPTDDFAEYNNQEPLHVKIKIIHKELQPDGKFFYGVAFVNIKSFEITQLKKAIDFMFFNLHKYSGKPESGGTNGQ